MDDNAGATAPLNVVIRKTQEEIQRLAGRGADIWWVAEYLGDYGDELAARLAIADVLLQQAHDAMMDWHLVHGGPDIFASAEERAMGAACRAIQDYRAEGE